MTTSSSIWKCLPLNLNFEGQPANRLWAGPVGSELGHTVIKGLSPRLCHDRGHVPAALTQNQSPAADCQQAGAMELWQFTALLGLLSSSANLQTHPNSCNSTEYTDFMRQNWPLGLVFLMGPNFTPWNSDTIPSTCTGRNPSKWTYKAWNSEKQHEDFFFLCIIARSSMKQS